MRLKSEFWVKAYLRRCAVGGATGVVLRHGDDDAGAIFVKIVRGDRLATVFSPAPAGLDEVDIDRRWVRNFSGQFVEEIEAQEFVDRQLRFDTDAWVVEIEDRDGSDYLGEELLE